MRRKPKILLLVDPANGKTKKTLMLKIWGDAGGVTQVGNELTVGNLDCGGAYFVKTFEDNKFPHRDFSALCVVDLTADSDTQ